MTFLELKQRLESLTPEQLAEPVRWWGDERGGTIDDLHVLDEEYVLTVNFSSKPLNTGASIARPELNVRTGPANSNHGERIPCSCGGECVLCDDRGMRPIDTVDVVRLRRVALNRDFRELARMCDRALADDTDLVAWHACAEALR